MILTVTILAAQTRILTDAIARLTFVILGLEHLARCLMLELIVLAQKSLAKATLEYASAVLVNTAFAFHTGGVRQRTSARMRLQTLSPVANPSFTKVANGTDHSEASCKNARMPDNAIARFQHAFHFATLRTDRQTLNALTKVAESSRFLLPVCSVDWKKIRELAFWGHSHNIA